jgi:hypothetical protein
VSQFARSRAIFALIDATASWSRSFMMCPPALITRARQ